MTVKLSDGEQLKISRFIDEMWQAGKSTKCGSGRGDFEEAYTKGKGAEVALKRFLLDRGVKTSVDFEVYQGADESDLKQMQADDGTTFTPDVEVKQCPHYGEWVAIPESTFRNIDSGTPIVQVKYHSDDEYEIAGWCLPEDLHVIEQGERVFTQYGDNYCKRIDNLSTDWMELVRIMSDGRTTADSPSTNFTFRTY